MNKRINIEELSDGPIVDKDIEKIIRNRSFLSLKVVHDYDEEEYRKYYFKTNTFPNFQSYYEVTFQATKYGERYCTIFGTIIFTKRYKFYIPWLREK